MKTVNITLKIPDEVVTSLESYYNNNKNCELISFRVIPNTEKLYENDSVFRKLVKAEKEARKIKELYINEKN